MYKMQAENIKNNIQTVVFGCRLNALEAEKIQSMLQPCVSSAILINTCAVTAEAERQSAQAVRKIAREHPKTQIFVTGCAATRNPGLFSKIANVHVVSNANKMQISSYIGDDARTPTIIPHVSDNPHMSKQFIQVQNGCNHKCTFCITRALRGPATSFAYDDILRDAHAAIRNGFNEIVLTGIDTASYVRDGMLISDLCARLLSDVPGIQRLRISSMDPASPEIFKIMDLMAADSRMMPHMHLSMQSGSDVILSAMGRRHSADTVRRIARRAEQIGVTFGWDIICGFPGETDELWRETMDLVRDIRPVRVHAFPFSPRPGTPAAEMPNHINRAISKQRVHEITDAVQQIRTEFMKSRIGDTASVLVESGNIARDPHDMTVRITGAPIAPRTICNVMISDVSDDEIIAKPA